jgi:hypothetical protein
MGKQRWIAGITRSIEGMLDATARAPVGFASEASIRGRLERIEETWDRASLASDGATDREIAAAVVRETFGATRPDALVLDEDIGAVSTAGRAVAAVVAEVGDVLELENRVEEAARDAADAVRAATEGLPEPERRRLEEAAVAGVANKAAAAAVDRDPGRAGMDAALAAEAEARRVERELALERSRAEELARVEREREQSEARRLEIVRMIVLGMTLAQALDQARRQELVREQEQKREEHLRLELTETRQRTRGISMEMTL